MKKMLALARPRSSRTPWSAGRSARAQARSSDPRSRTEAPAAALAGAAIGAGSGALIGAAATPPPPYGGPPYAGQCARWGYDYNGNGVCVAYY